MVRGRKRIIAGAAASAAGAALVVRGLKARRRRRDAEERWSEIVDEAGMESFPASDPPGWTLGGHRPD